MKDVTLKEQSWHFFIYRQIHGFDGKVEGIKNLCPYFWGVVLAIVSLPVTWVGLFVPVKKRDSGIAISFIITLVPYIFITIGRFIGRDIREKWQWGWISETLIGQTLFGLVVIALVLGFVLGVVIVCCRFAEWNDQRKRRKKLKKKKEGKEEKPEPSESLLLVKWEAFKGKYCPKIDWK